MGGSNEKGEVAQIEWQSDKRRASPSVRVKQVGGDSERSRSFAGQQAGSNGGRSLDDWILSPCADDRDGAWIAGAVGLMVAGGLRLGAALAAVLEESAGAECRYRQEAPEGEC